MLRLLGLWDNQPGLAQDLGDEGWPRTWGMRGVKAGEGTEVSRGQSPGFSAIWRGRNRDMH